MAYYCIYRFSHQQSPHCPIPSRWFHTDFAKRTPPWPKKWGKSPSFRPKKKNIAGIPNMGCWSKPLIIPFFVSPCLTPHKSPSFSPPFTTLDRLGKPPLTRDPRRFHGHQHGRIEGQHLSCSADAHFRSCERRMAS